MTEFAHFWAEMTSDLNIDIKNEFCMPKNILNDVSHLYDEKRKNRKKTFFSKTAAILDSTFRAIKSELHIIF